MSNSQQNAPSLSYFLSENKKMIVLSLNGALSRANIDILNLAMNEVEKRSLIGKVALNFHGVTTADKSVVPLFARFLKTLRERPAYLRLCSLNGFVHDLLSAEGILRKEETSATLKEALESLLGEGANQEGVSPAPTGDAKAMPKTLKKSA